ncbi:MAG: MFS transporter, partial [Chloroflexi bacterium]|nr:MFS transporter [Chloroflexota bacterium]
MAEEQAGRDPLSAAAKWLQFSVVAMGLFAAVLDMGMVNVALPTIAGDFGLPLPDVSWVVLGPGLALSAALLPVGTLSDVIGRRRVYILGI